MLEDVSDLPPGDCLLSVVSPVYGCRTCLSELVDGVAAAASGFTDSFEVILVDDASPDDAWPTIVQLAATRPWLQGLRLSRNFGQHAAIHAGISRSRGEWTVVMDCDLQDQPRAIPELYRTAIDQQVDVVFAQRVDRQDSATKRFGSWAFYRLLSWLTGTAYDASIANFGIYHRRAIEAVIRMPERSRAFPLMIRWVGLPATSIPVEHAPRTQGETGYTFSKLIGLATSISLSYSDKPLRLVAGGGLVCAGIALLMAVATVALFVTGSITVAGFTSVMTAIWLLGSLTLFAIGVVGLYLGQVFRDVQGRPTAIISDTTR